MTRETRSPKELSRGASRRQFLQWSTAAAAASALAGVAIPRVHAAENNTIRLALIGCGGRGSGAVGNAMNSVHGPVELYAMADVVEDRLTSAHKALSDQFADRVDVPKERQFVGFDAYKKAIDCLGPQRRGHADQLRLRPSAPAGVRREEGRERLHGEIVRARRPELAANDAGRRGSQEEEPQDRRRPAVPPQREPAGTDQADPRRTAGRNHAGPRLPDSSGRRHGQEAGEHERTDVADPQFHLLLLGLRRTVRRDEHPPDRRTLLAQGRLARHGPRHRRPAGRTARTTARASTRSRSSGPSPTAPRRPTASAGWADIASASSPPTSTEPSAPPSSPATSTRERRASTRTSGSPNDNIVWEAPEEKYNPWDAEWNVLLDSIRQDKPQNEVERAAMSNFADLMGRAAVHSGKEITWDEMTNSKFQLYPGKIDDLNYDSEPPVKADADGYYPVPVPGVWKET